MSALDDAVEHFDPGPRARVFGDGDRADAYDAASAELAAMRAEIARLKAKVEKADAMERAAFNAEAYIANYEPHSNPVLKELREAIDAYRSAP